MKLISATDIALLRRLPRMLAAVIIAGLWLAGMWFLYSASPYVPRWTTTSSHPGRTWVEFANGGQTLVVGTRPDGVLTLWDVATGRPRRVIEHPARRELLEMRVLAGGKFVQASYAPGEIEIRIAATGKLILKLSGAEHPSWAIDVAPDGKHFAAIPSDARKAPLYAPVPADPEGFNEASRIELPTSAGVKAKEVFFAPDGQRFLGLFWNDTRTVGDFIVAESATGRPLSQAIAGDPFAWSDDGKRLVVATSLNELAVLDTATFSEIAALKLPKNVVIIAAAFRPDNNTIVLVEAWPASSHAVRLWDIAAKQAWIAAELPPNFWLSSEFLVGDAQLAVYCRQESNAIWRRLLQWVGRSHEEPARTRAALYDLSGTGAVSLLPDNTLFVAQDGKAAASIDNDTGAIAVWDIPPRRNWMRLAGLAGLVAVPIVLLGFRWRRRSRS